MFANYLKLAWRNVGKNKLLAFINIGSLSIGIAAVLMIGLYIYGEISYDRFQQNKSSVYRVGFKFWQNGKLLGEGAEFTAPFAADAQRELAGIKTYTRVSSPRTAIISYGNKSIKLDNIRYADSTFFTVFSYKLLQGRQQSVLASPHTIVLTTETSNKLFGDENPVGKLVALDGQNSYTVTGVAREAPVNSHLSYSALASFSTLYAEPGSNMEWNGGEQYSAYLQLDNGINAANIEKGFPAFLWRHINQQYATRAIKVDANLQPLQDIHLYYSDNSNTLRNNIYVFGIVALLILVISCVNYVNLTMAQATGRFKEVGVRKVLGALRGQLVKQFLIETLLLTCVAFFVAIILVLVIEPVFSRAAGKQLATLAVSTLPALLILFLIVMGLGAIAGSYVSFYLASFDISRIFKTASPKSIQSRFKKALIVAQFAITIGLMACTAEVALQLKYSKHINMGFDKQQLLVLPLTGEIAQKNYAVLQQQLSQLNAVIHVSAVSQIPYNGITNNGFVPEGDTKALILHQLDADENLLETFKIKMAAGKYFSKADPALANGYVINETLAKLLGWQHPVGKTISRNGKHTIIGVVSDFHFASLHDKIEPLIITNKPEDGRYSYLAVKYSTSDVKGLVGTIQQTWKATFNTTPFDYWFLDDAFNTVYKSEEHFQQLFTGFAGLSMVLSLAGVFGLVALTIKQRVKEFGIRKVLGAGVTDIVFITVKEFAALIILGAAIITPVAWFYMHGWLENFAYHVGINAWLFITCGLAVFIITVSVISFQAVKAATANPVKSLRLE